MTKEELKYWCKRYANVYLPCGLYSSALSLYQRKMNCGREKAREAIGLCTGSEIKEMLNL